MTGDIVVVRERKTKNEFALKTIQKSNMSEKMLNVLRREVEILASLDHVSFFFYINIFQMKSNHHCSVFETHNSKKKKRLFNKNVISIEI